jgi:hypothetical protein
MVVLDQPPGRLVTLPLTPEKPSQTRESIISNGPCPSRRSSALSFQREHPSQPAPDRRLRRRRAHPALPGLRRPGRHLPRTHPHLAPLPRRHRSIGPPPHLRPRPRPRGRLVPPRRDPGRLVSCPAPPVSQHDDERGYRAARRERGSRRGVDARQPGHERAGRARGPGSHGVDARTGGDAIVADWHDGLRITWRPADM